MARLFAFNAAFFLAPFLVYALWLLARRGTITGAAQWPFRVILYLCLAGIVLMAGGLVALTSFSGADPNAVYRPAVLRDGRIEPGGFEAPNRTPAP